ncbi:MAG: hypothetical protein KC613_19880, partial [Myxococcales bacterium]|nr:hypothetical protein [Myxococcales bacterium]
MLRTRSALALLALTLTVGCDDGDPAPAQQGADGAVTADAGADQAVADQGAGDMALADMAPADMAPDMAPPDMDPPAPGEPGPFAVGFHVETIEYAAPELEAPRPLDLHWWYPTAASEGERVRYGNLLLRPEVFGGAPPLADLADAPVLVFSHGNGGFGEQSYFFTEFLASHGWVV